MASILIVDDDMHLRRILSHFLKEEGYRTLEAKTAAEAVAVLGEFDVDAIILDVMMPGGDGLSLCRKLKSLPNREHIPVIMCTARSRKEDIVGAIRSGADDYIVKPFTRDIIAKKVQRVLSPAQPAEAGTLLDEAERRASRRASVNWVVSWGASAELGISALYKNKVINISNKGFAFEFERCQTCTGYELSTVHPMCLLARHAKRFEESGPLEFVLSVSRDVVVEVNGVIAHVYQPPGWTGSEIVGVSYTDLTPEAESQLQRYTF